MKVAVASIDIETGNRNGGVSGTRRCRFSPSVRPAGSQAATWWDGFLADEQTAAVTFHTPFEGQDDQGLSVFLTTGRTLT